MRKQCKRKVWGLVDPITLAKQGACITNGKELALVRVLELSALEAMCAGKGTLDDWKELADMLNRCECMARGGIGHEALPYCEAAEREMISAAKTYQETRKMVLSTEGIAALREVYAYHDLQRTSVSRREYELWIRKSMCKVKSMAPGVIDVAEAIAG